MRWVVSRRLVFLAALAHIMGYDKRDEAWRHALLVDETRARIMEIVWKHPGVNETVIAERCEITRAATRYHLDLLMTGEWVQKRRLGRENHYFSTETRKGKRETLARARHGRAWEVLRVVLYEPGIQQKDLAERVGMTRKVLRPHIDLLIDAGLVGEVAGGRTRQYFPGKRADVGLVEDFQLEGVAEAPAWFERRIADSESER